MSANELADELEIGLNTGNWVDPQRIKAATMLRQQQAEIEALKKSINEALASIPAYELQRLASGHDAKLRSAKFGPSSLDGDVPVFLRPNEGEENEA